MASATGEQRLSLADLCVWRVCAQKISVLKKVITPRAEYGEQKKNEYIGERKYETQEQEEIGVTKRHTSLLQSLLHHAGHSGRQDV